MTRNVVYLPPDRRKETKIGNELLKDREVRQLLKILDRIINQMSLKEQDRLNDAEVFIGYYHD